MKRRIFGALVGLFAVVAVAQSVPADAATHPASWTWTGARVYAAGQAWELDSPNRAYRAVWQTDHNFVVYHGSRAVWSSATAGVKSDGLIFTASSGGHLLHGAIAVGIYCPGTCAQDAGTKQWSNRVNDSTSAHRVVMQNDGNLVEYTGAAGGRALWATNTTGR